MQVPRTKRWITVHSVQSWSRIFDFGTNSSGEITAPGGTFNGTDYLMVSANIGPALDMRFERMTGGTQDTAGATVLGTRMHIVATYETWRKQHFGTPENTGNGADEADPDNDGLKNLLERAFAGNPNASDPDVQPAVDSTAPLLSIT
jgi:hypothetical protein